MSMPPITPQPASPTPQSVIPGDVFDRAMALSQNFSDNEVRALERNQNRLFWLLGAIGAVIIAIVGVTDWKTVSTAREKAVETATSEAKKQVDEMLPQLVSKDADEKFKEKNIGDVVKRRVEEMTDTYLNAEIQKRVEPIVRDEIVKQRSEIERQIRRELASPPKNMVTKEIGNAIAAFRGAAGSIHSPNMEIRCPEKKINVSRLVPVIEAGNWSTSVKGCAMTPVQGEPEMGKVHAIISLPLANTDNAYLYVAGAISVGLNTLGVPDGAKLSSQILDTQRVILELR